MQVPNLVFYGYLVVALVLLYCGWKCWSLEETGRDKIFRWLTNFWLGFATAVFLLLGLVFLGLGWVDGVVVFYRVYAVPPMIGLVAFNAGYWSHMLADIINCVSRIG